MKPIYKLKNQVKHYDWGSPAWIPQLLGADNASGAPWAELWMGVHPGAPSQALLNGEGGGGEIALGALIAQDPRRFLGRGEPFGDLPFLFKLLAAAKPLSIQAHPSREQARLGWERENERGLAPDAPDRNYRDGNHKPEIICALSPFTAMCGFREPGDIAALMEKFFGAAPRALRQGLRGLDAALAEPAADRALKAFLKALFGLSPETRQELTAYILKTDNPGGGGRVSGPPDTANSWENMRRFAELYPGDPGIIAPVYLNLLKLAPGEAIYLDAGVLHAYIEGFGVELMANSDNVLRGGLTPKHVDVEELMGALDFHPLKPEILTPRLSNSAPQSPTPGGAGFFRYATPCREFSLAVMNGRGGEQAFPGGPAIIIVTRGSVRISARASSGESEELVLCRGESAFIPAGDPNGLAGPERQTGSGLSFEGDYTLYAAGLPRE
jgi:mannose-6-phosphate isomerase